MSAMAESLSAQSIERLAEGTRQDWHVPGMALAVVRDGQVVVRAGFGERDVAQHLPVTPQTLFAIASATKPFTTMLLGLLVDDHLLDWDRPVRDYLPTFKLYDTVATERITTRDLVTHRSGLPGHERLFSQAVSRRELFERLQYLEPSADFRSRFQYQNLTFMAAGYLAGELSGETWEEAVQRRIFAPLGMHDTNCSVTVSQQRANFALPYTEQDSTIVPLEFATIDAKAPGAGINSTLDDMVAWLQFHLNHGRHGDAQLVSAQTLAHMHTPQVLVQDEYLQTIFQAELLAYGLGWCIQDYRGHKLVQHGGKGHGFTALVSFLPHERTGIVTLTNLDSTLLTNALSFTIYDQLLGLEPIDWSARLQRVLEGFREAAKQVAATAEATGGQGAPPPHPRDAYVGAYEHPGYGRLIVEPADDGLRAIYNGLVYRLEPLNYDAFRMRSDAALSISMSASFYADTRGAINRFAVAMEPRVPEIVFMRLPEISTPDDRP